MYIIVVFITSQRVNIIDRSKELYYIKLQQMSVVGIWSEF